MKKITSILFALFIFSTISYTQTVDEILDNYFEAIGQEQLNEVETITVHGKSVTGPNEFPFTVYIKAPNKLRIEVDIQGQQMVQVYDGETGWQIVPWSGTMEPMDMDENQVKALSVLADIEGPLYNYKEKGYKATLLEDKEYEGTPVYKIELEVDDDVKINYIFDQETYIPLAQEYIAIIQGQEVNQETVFGNYQMIEGIAFSFSDQVKVNGQVQRNSKTESIELDNEIDDTIYLKPEPTEKESEETAPEENQ